MLAGLCTQQLTDTDLIWPRLLRSNGDDCPPHSRPEELKSDAPILCPSPKGEETLVYFADMTDGGAEE